MRTIVVIYQVHELSQHAQSRAYFSWLASSHYAWARENEKTLSEFSALFCVRCHHVAYDAERYFYRFSTALSDIEQSLSGVRLATYLNNNYRHWLFAPKTFSGKAGRVRRKSQILVEDTCVLTGYYMDDLILLPIYEFLEKPDPAVTFTKLLDKCLDSFFRCCRDDIAAYESRDNFFDTSTAHEWRYLQDGTLFK